MSFRSGLQSILAEWHKASAMQRIAIVSVFLTIIGGGGLTGILSWARSRFAMPRVTEPLRSAVPAYFDLNDLSRYEKWGIDAGTAGRIAALLRTENQLDDARDLLLRLRDRVTTREAIDFINGLITATWYGEERHREGLDFLGEITKGLPPNDLRYRFQFHAHLHAVSAREGIEQAEKLIAEMRRKYHRVEYTRVWLGVPLANMESLHRGLDVTEGGPPELADEDRDYLQKLTREIQGDPFIDHALYFLRNYERLIREYPKSLLRPAAMQLWIYDAVDCKSNPANCRVTEAHSRLAQLGADYPALLPETRIHAASLLAAAGRVLEAEELGCAREVDCFGGRETILRGALESHGTRAVDVIVWLARADPHLLERKLDAIILALDEAPQLVQARDYTGAVAVLDRCNKAMGLQGITPSPMFLRRFAAFRRLEDASTRGDASGYFELGLAEADAATIGPSVEFAHLLRNNAAESFGRVQELAPGTNLAAKASYLRAAAYRRMQNYEASLEELEHFLDTYHSSPLYDDVLAEKGVHLVDLGRSTLESDEIFAQVADNFPADNAADNALTWMAKTRVRHCCFAEALSIYERIAARYPANRLGVYAREQILTLNPIVSTRTYRSAIAGLVISLFPSASGAYVLDVQRGSAADNADMMAGDVIIAVGNRKVTDAASYYSAMTEYQPGTLTRLTVRGNDRIRYVTIVVNSSDHYSALPAGSKCPD